MRRVRREDPGTCRGRGCAKLRRLVPTTVTVTSRRCVLLLAALLLGCPGRQPPTEPGVTSAALAGDWVGGYRIGKRYALFGLHLPRETNARPSFDMPAEGIAAEPLGDYLPAGDALRFTLPGPRSEVALQGHLEHESLLGAARCDGQEGSFEMRRTRPMEAAAQREYMGLYDAGSGHLVAVERLPELEQLHFADFFSGRFNAIFPDDAPDVADRFFAGSALLVAAPAVMHLVFNRDPSGAIVSLAFQQDGEPDVIAVRVPIRETPVEFRSGAVGLAGTLIEPARTQGPHPVVVLVPGESEAPRDAYRKNADFLVSQGFAALVYDRRGVGASQGKGEPAAFSELADDALAAVELLRGRSGVDPEHIGLWGHSQGGWVATLAASRSRSVGFVINVSTPTMAAAEQESYRIEHNMRADGFAEPQILEAVNYQRILMEWVRDGTGRDTLMAVHRAAPAAPWATYVTIPRLPLPEQPHAERPRAVQATTRCRRWRPCVVRRCSCSARSTRSCRSSAACRSSRRRCVRHKPPGQPAQGAAAHRPRHVGDRHRQPRRAAAGAPPRAGLLAAPRSVAGARKGQLRAGDPAPAK